MAAARSPRLNELKRSDSKRDKITRQWLRFIETHPLHSVCFVRFFRDLRIRNSRIVLWNMKRDLPRDLESWLIEAGERTARVNRFELGEQVVIAAAGALENAGTRS